MRRSTIFIAALALAALTACDSSGDKSRHRSHHHGYSVDAEGGSIYVKNNDLVIRADQASIARIHPDASLSIDGDEVAVSETGRKALNGYRAAYKVLAEDSIRLGLDGVDLGVSTLHNVLKGLLDGTADEAGKEADRRGKEIDQLALGLCGKLSALRDAQQNVVELVPKFADYAVIDAKEVQDCFDDKQKDADEDGREVDKPDLPTPPGPPTPPTPPSPAKKSMSFNINMDSGNWSVRHGAVLIPHAGGNDDKEASVSADGSLHIGEKLVDVPAAGREALVRFHHNALKVEDEGVGLGLAGVDIALGAVGSAIHGVFGGDGDQAEKDLERRGEAMNVRVKRMCGYLAGMRIAQQDAVAAVPDFAPYATVTEKGVRECGVNKHKSKEPADAAPAT